MSKERPRVPGMRDVKPNREQRRHPRRLAAPGNERADSAPPDDEPPRERVHEDIDVRAKSTGHDKKTADKWNQ